MRVALVAYDAEGDMSFGSHVDNAVRAMPGGAGYVWTDVFSTLFISSQDDYDGAEFVAEDTYGSHEVKLPAGDMIVYPGDSVHHVKPVTRGSRIASLFWTQSMVRDTTHRRLLLDLDIRLNADHPELRSLVSLTSLYNNLLRQWREL